MTIEKARPNRRIRGPGRRRGTGRRRDKDNMNRRTPEEQLDFEMELLKAQREGREEEFRTEEAQKRKAARTATLDAEMDEYFKNRDKPQPPSTEKSPPAQPETRDPNPSDEPPREDAQPASTT